MGCAPSGPGSYCLDLALYVSLGRRSESVDLGIDLSVSCYEAHEVFFPGLQIKPGKSSGLTCIHVALREDKQRQRQFNVSGAIQTALS